MIYRWVIGLLVSLVAGWVIIYLFLFAIRRSIGLGHKPSLGGAKLEEGKSPRVPGWVTGIVERLFFTILVAVDVQGIPTALVAWIGIKLATNWNHPDWRASASTRAFAFSALLAGLLSMLFAFLGGWICSGRLLIGI